MRTWWDLERLLATMIPHRQYHARQVALVEFRIGTVAVILKPGETIHMATQLHVDQILNLAIQAFDSKGNLIVPTPAFDKPPTWTDSNPAAATDAPSADGTTNVLTPVASAVGQNMVEGVTASIGGTQFSASVSVTVVAGAVASIAIAATPAAAPTAAATPPAAS